MNMAFRQRLAMMKNFVVGICESGGPNLTAANSQIDNRPKGFPVFTLCKGSHTGDSSASESIRNTANFSNRGNVSPMQFITPQTKFNKEHHLLSNVKQSHNPLWMSGIFIPHFSSISHGINTVHALRNFTTFVPIQRRPVVLQTVIKEINMKCCKMKHSLPKVPPTRMMSVYDLERTITDEEAAKEFVYALKISERKYLYEELARFHGDPNALSAMSVEPPTRQQLKLVTLHQMFPFIGFGFLDNFLMIVAGEYIDLMLGTALGISTMTAAALGNWFSDVCGLGSAHYVENFVTRFGIRHPHLSPAQVDMKSTKWASNFGKVIGVTIGCFLGMIPLLFFRADKKEDKDKDKKEKTETSEPKEHKK